MPALRWISSTSPAGLAKRLSRKVMTAPLGPASTLLDPGLAAGALDRDDLEQILDLGRQGPEAVDQLGGKAVDLAPVGECGDAAVEPEPHAEIGDIGSPGSAPACRS